jgi:hypothetical protein
MLETHGGLELSEQETTQPLIDRDYDQFIDVIDGRRERFRTCPEDTRGYVSATNGMFISSGGIHDIDPAFIRHSLGDGMGDLEVLHLREAVQECLLTGRLFSEQGLGWAVARPVPVPLEGPGLGCLISARLALQSGLARAEHAGAASF